MSEGYSLVLAFPDQSPSFVHGFTCGRVWQRMSDGAAEINETVPAECRSTIEAMAMAKGWTEKISDAGDGYWLYVQLVNPKQEPPNDQ